MAPKAVASNLIDVIIKGHLLVPPNQVPALINAVGLIISRLPESYWNVIFDKIQEVMNSACMLDWDLKISPFVMFNFEYCSKAMLDKTAVSLLAVAQSIFHHFGAGQIGQITE